MCIRPIILNCIADTAAQFQTWNSTSICAPNVFQNTSNLPGGSHTREHGDVGLQVKVKIIPKGQTFNIPGGFDIWSLTFDLEVQMKQLTIVRCRIRNLVNTESMTIFPVFSLFGFLSKVVREELNKVFSQKVNGLSKSWLLNPFCLKWDIPYD